MNIKLSGGLGHIQAVLKELVDGSQCLLVELVRRLSVKYLADKHFAQRNGQLINQTSDTQVVVSDNVLIGVENLATSNAILASL